MNPSYPGHYPTLGYYKVRGLKNRNADIPYYVVIPAKAGLPVAVATPTGILALSGVSGCQPPFTRGQALRGNDEWVEGVVVLTTDPLVCSQNERG